MENNKYFLYARKSTESKLSQTQSLGDQVKIMKNKAQALGITIVDTFLESKSAKDMGRPLFNEMIQRINNGEATGETREYIYYHCTKKKKDIACDEKVIRIEPLEEQITTILEGIEIDTGFKSWVYEAIKENYNAEFEARAKIFKSLVSSIASEEKREKNLTNMLLDELISKEDFKVRKNEIQQKITTLKDKRDKMNMKGEEVMKFTEQVFDFTFNLVDSFKNGSIQRRKEMLSSIGKNFILKGGVLGLELEPWYGVIQTEYPKLKMEIEGLEPTKKDTSSELLSAFDSKKFKWWVIRGSNSGPSP